MDTELESRFDEINQKFKMVDARLDEHTRILDEHTRKLDEHSEALARIEARQDVQDENIVALMGAVEKGFSRMQRYFDIVLEDIRSDFRAFKEQGESEEDHLQRINQLTATCDRLEKRAS